MDHGFLTNLPSKDLAYRDRSRDLSQLGHRQSGLQQRAKSAGLTGGTLFWFDRWVAARRAGWWNDRHRVGRRWRGIRFISGSTPAGGVITPPDRAKSELVVPLKGGVIGRVGSAASGRPFGSAAKAAMAPNKTTAAATANIPRIAASIASSN